MASVVNGHEFRGRGRSAGYPWEEWFDGRTWRLEEGKDFTVSRESMAMAAYQRAHREGGIVNIDKASEKGFVFIRYTAPARKLKAAK